MPDEKIVKEFPCPKCGSTDRFMERVAAKERAKGVLPPDMPAALDLLTMAVANPKPPIPYMPGTIKPCGTALFDICFECGTYYCFKVIESEAALGNIQRLPRGHP